MSAEVITPEARKLNGYAQTTALLLTLVELGWVVPWYELLLRSSLQMVRFQAMLVFGGLMLAVYVAILLSDILNLTRGIRLAVLGLLLGLGMALAGALVLGQSFLALIRGLFDLDPPAIFTFIVVLWMGWRGLSLAQESSHPQVAWQRFSLGLAMFLIYIFVISWVGVVEPNLGWFLFFLFTGFLALLFSRVAYIAERSSTSNPFDRRWLAGVALLIAALLALAAVMSSLLTGQFSLVLDLLAQGVAWLVRALLFLVALPGMLIAGLLGGFMAWLRDRLGRGDVELSKPLEQPFPYLLPETPPEPQPLSPQIQSLIFWVIAALILAWVFWRFGRRLQRTRLPMVTQPESLLEPGEARRLLRKAFQNTLDELAERLRPQRKALPAEKIRQVYIELLELFAGMDLSRPFNQTPLEFLPDMQTRLPEVAGDLEEITHAYLQVRYGEMQEASSQVARVEAAWQRVAQAGRQISKETS
jgi:hypothetical protein